MGNVRQCIRRNSKILSSFQNMATHSPQDRLMMFGFLIAKTLSFKICGESKQILAGRFTPFGASGDPFPMKVVNDMLRGGVNRSSFLAKAPGFENYP